MTSIAILLAISADLEAVPLLLVGTTVLVGQLSIGWSNDWLDATRDFAADRTDKPTARGSIEPTTLRVAALWAGSLAVPLSLLAGWAGAWHLLLVGSGWAYNVRLKMSSWSPAPYAVGFGALPLYVLSVAGVAVDWWVPAAGAALGVAAHFANAAPDVEQDRELGVCGMPQRIGARRSLVLALALLGCVGGVLLTQIGLSGPGKALAGALVALPLLAGTTLVLRGRIERPAFTLVMVGAVVDVALLVVAS